MIKVKSCFGKGCEAINSKRKYDAVLGISVGSRAFSKKAIENYLLFCLDHFDRILILIVDSIKKYNFMAFSDLSEKEALEKAMYEGDEFYKAVKRVIKTLQLSKHDTSRLKLAKWDEVASEIKSRNIVLKLLKKEYAENSVFSIDCLQMTNKYFEARTKIKSRIENKEIAVNFLLEELALFLTIGSSEKFGHAIDVYPGKFEVMENILDNKYRDLLKKLPEVNYGHIEIE